MPALILAGAGSGKTCVLTTRIAWLLQTGHVSRGGVLVVIFTNKAAKEMLTRLSAMLSVAVRGMWIGTFHRLRNGSPACALAVSRPMTVCNRQAQRKAEMPDDLA